MTLTEILLNHLEYTFEREAWQPSLMMAIEGLTAEQAAWKPAPERHSIWQIVRHVTHWKQAVLQHWQGQKPDYGHVERTDWQEVSGDDSAWQTDVRALHDISARLREKVQSLEEDALQRPFSGGEMPIVLRVMRMATHDIYHAGQIRYIRALRGM